MTYFSIVHVKMPTFLQCADTLASRFKRDVGHHGAPGALRHGRFPQFSIVHTITNDRLGGWWCFIIWYQFHDTSLISTKVNCKSNRQIPWESPYLIRKLSRDHITWLQLEYRNGDLASKVHIIKLHSFITQHSNIHLASCLVTPSTNYVCNRYTVGRWGWRER